MIDHYGIRAEGHARRRLQDMIGRRDVGGAGVWRRVLRAIHQLQDAGGRTKH